MKKILFLLLVVMVAALPIIASGANTKKTTDEDTGISFKDVRDAKVVPIKYKEKKGIDTVLKEIFPFLPIEAGETIISVEINGAVVAEISPDSKFVGIEVHDVCLEYQYGTQSWYNCEGLLK